MYEGWEKEKLDLRLLELESQLKTLDKESRKLINIEINGNDFYSLGGYLIFPFPKSEAFSKTKFKISLTMASDITQFGIDNGLNFKPENIQQGIEHVVYKIYYNSKNMGPSDIINVNDKTIVHLKERTKEKMEDFSIVLRKILVHNKSIETYIRNDVIKSNTNANKSIGEMRQLLLDEIIKVLDALLCVE
jgi:hypothetical protein